MYSDNTFKNRIKSRTTSTVEIYKKKQSTAESIWNIKKRDTAKELSNEWGYRNFFFQMKLDVSVIGRVHERSQGIIPRVIIVGRPARHQRGGSQWRSRVCIGREILLDHADAIQYEASHVVVIVIVIVLIR